MRSIFRILNTHQSKLSKKFVVSSHLSLTLTHFNLHLSLTISSCRKYLGKKETSWVGSLIKLFPYIKYKPKKETLQLWKSPNVH